MAHNLGRCAVTNKIKFLLISCLLMFISSGVIAGPIMGSITFTGNFTDGITSVSGTGDYAGSLPSGSSVILSPLGWEADGYQFAADWPTFHFTAPWIVEGYGDLTGLGTTIMARLSAIFDISDEGYSFKVTTTAVPEPQTLALLGIALLVFGTIKVIRGRKKS